GPPPNRGRGQVNILGNRSVSLVTAARSHRSQPGVVLEPTIPVERVPDTGDDVVHRIPDIAVPGKLVRIERGVDGLHEPLRRMPGGRVAVPEVDGARIAR